MIEIQINWDCDYDFYDSCFPEYQFVRFDSKSTETSSGFNFRLLFLEEETKLSEIKKIIKSCRRQANHARELLLGDWMLNSFV